MSKVKIIRRKDKFYVVNNKIKSKPYSTKEEAEYKLELILASKLKKSNIIDFIEKSSLVLKKKGMIHISDALISCANMISNEIEKDNIIISLCKIISLLRNKKENETSEQLSNYIPDILSLEKCGSDKMKINQNGVSADRVYKMTIKLYEKYAVGLIDYDSFEYKKMKEFKSMLKNGFELPAPSNMEIPKNMSNWWEYFSKRGK